MATIEEVKQELEKTEKKLETTEKKLKTEADLKRIRERLRDEKFGGDEKKLLMEEKSDLGENRKDLKEDRKDSKSRIDRWSYIVEPIDAENFRFDLPVKQPINILKNELEHHLPADYFNEIQLPETQSIIEPSSEFHGGIQHHVLTILKNEKEGGSENGLHGRDGGILGIISLLSGLDSNRNITCSSTLKRKRVDAHVHEVSVVLMEEKFNKYNRLELMLELTPVGIVNSVKTLQQLRKATGGHIRRCRY